MKYYNKVITLTLHSIKYYLICSVKILSFLVFLLKVWIIVNSHLNSQSLQVLITELEASEAFKMKKP